MDCCASSCCCYCCHCHCHPHHHCHGTTMPTVLPNSNQRQKSLNRLIAAKRLPELPSSKQQKLAPESSQSLSSPDDREDTNHKHQHQQQHRQHLHIRPHQQRRRHHNQCSRLPDKIPTGGTIAIEIDAATLTDDISYCSSMSNNSFALAMANETTNSKDILVHCSGNGDGVDNHLPHNEQRRRKSRTRAHHHCGGQASSHIDSVCSTTSTTEDEVVVVQRKCKRGKFIPREDTLDGAADVEEDDDEGKLTRLKTAKMVTMTTTCCDANCNEGVKIKRKNFTNRYYCSSCSKCSSCSCCQQEQDGELQNSCSFSSSLSHIEDDCAQVDDGICSRCDAKAIVDGNESDDEDAACDHSSSQQSAESFCSCNSTSRCYCSCSCDESDTIRKESSTTTPATMSDVSTPVETPFGGGTGGVGVSGIAGNNYAEDAFSMAGKSSVSQSEYFSLSSDKPPSHSLASSPMSPPPTDSVMPSPPALPRKHCKHYSKHHRHKSDGNFDTVL